MDSPCIKQTVCKVLKIFQHGKYLVAYVLKLVGTQRLSSKALFECFCYIQCFAAAELLLVRLKFAEKQEKKDNSRCHTIYNMNNTAKLRDKITLVYYTLMSE